MYVTGFLTFFQRRNKLLLQLDNFSFSYKEFDAMNSVAYEVLHRVPERKESTKHMFISLHSL